MSVHYLYIKVRGDCLLMVINDIKVFLLFLAYIIKLRMKMEIECVKEATTRTKKQKTVKGHQSVSSQQQNLSLRGSLQLAH